MDTIFSFDDNNYTNKINLDELYEKKKEKDLKTLYTYNKILNRIHKKIKNVSRQNINNQFCWYLIPEFIMGISNYDNTSCIAYIIDQLKENGLLIHYTHPNLLFISWKHWTPSYIRNEIKKKTGISIDGFGNKIKNNNISDNDNTNEILLSKKHNISKKPKENYKDIDMYKPTGKFIYNDDIINKLNNKSKIIKY
jgi:hypothetical protein